MKRHVSNKGAVELNDTCKLIAYAYAQDSIGNAVKSKTITTVFCGRLSVTQFEYYQGGLNEAKITLCLCVNVDEFNSNEYVEYDSREYKVQRTYERPDGLIELYLTEKAAL